MQVVIANCKVPKIVIRRSIGYKVCMRCGEVFLSDLRGCAKWCFKCKPIIVKEYHRDYKRRRRLDERQEKIEKPKYEMLDDNEKR